MYKGMLKSHEHDMDPRDINELFLILSRDKVLVTDVIRKREVACLTEVRESDGNLMGCSFFSIFSAAMDLV